MPAHETFRAAQQRLLNFLADENWLVSGPLKFPHATTPDGQARVYFTPQAVQLSESEPFSLGNAHSLWIDIRGMSGEEFLARVARRLHGPATPNAHGSQDMSGGWTFLTGDINWEDYGAKWAKKAADGTWFVVSFTNWEDAVGEREFAEGGHDKYIAEVLQVAPAELSEKQIRSALNSSGIDLAEIEPEHRELALLDAIVGCGTYAPIESFEGKRADSVRAAARRAADNLMRSPELLEAALDKPVNKIGTTAREFRSGDVMAGLTRYSFREGEKDPVKDVMLKIQGWPAR